MYERRRLKEEIGFHKQTYPGGLDRCISECFEPIRAEIEPYAMQRDTFISRSLPADADGSADVPDDAGMSSKSCSNRGDEMCHFRCRTQKRM